MADPRALPSQTALAKEGKPMRALRALASASEPLTEEQVYVETKRDYLDTGMWHAPLKQLCDRGLAERSGSRGGYRYAITDAGREVLSA